MKKNLYSLMLDDDVVAAVDAMAHRMETNRSALVNRILAEVVSVETPEQQIQNIFETIEELVRPGRELIPFFAPNSPTMSLKSSLCYKYRPTVKYEVELDREEGNRLGTLSVVFRTRSESLIDALAGFFRLWVEIERVHLTPRLGLHIQCSLYDGRFLRPIALPRQDCGAEEIARAISDYVQLFDRLLKAYLGGMPPRRIEQLYCEDLEKRAILI